MALEKDYVLGTHDEEIARLGLQHAVWRSRATGAWRRAGFTRGQTLMDLGCGRGYATFDLADIVGRDGRVIGIDRSRRFLDVLEAAARARGLAHIETLELDLATAEVPAPRGYSGSRSTSPATMVLSDRGRMCAFIAAITWSRVTALMRNGNSSR